MQFNPQAVLAYSPNIVFGSTSPTAPGASGNNTFASIERKNSSGRFALNCYDGRALGAALSATGISASNTYEYPEVCRLLHAMGFEPRDGQASPEYLSFLAEQFRVHAAGTPDPSYVLARDEFITKVDVLLARIQKAVYPNFKIRTTTNPRWARALSLRREGVFLWPDWRDERYLNVALGCGMQERPAVRDLLHDWLEETGLRVNTLGAH